MGRLVKMLSRQQAGSVAGIVRFFRSGERVTAFTLTRRVARNVRFERLTPNSEF